MKKIICYGDSNTFGYNPADGSRFDENIRWTGILKKNLFGEYEVINEGACDRTGFVDNSKGLLFSAQKHFPEMISKINKADVIVLALGSNDLQFQYNISFEIVESGLKKLILLAKKKIKHIIIVSPVELGENVLKGYFNFQFDKTSIEKSKKTGSLYKQIAEANECGYFDINKFAKPSEIDGLHYDEKSHKLIAEKLTDYIKKNF